MKLRRWFPLVVALLLHSCADDPGGQDGGGKDGAGGDARRADLIVGDTAIAKLDSGADGGSAPAAAPELWFTPNVASQDLLDLFTMPASWTHARGKLKVLQLYAAQVDPKPCASCGPNVIAGFVKAKAFGRLAGWGIDLALEVGALKEWGCAASVHGKITLDAMASVAASGGKVRHLAMDEPYIGGKHTVSGKSCGYTMQQSAAQTASYISQVKAVHPAVRIGDIEPYPYFTAAQLMAWIKEVDSQGAPLDFFHLDVDRTNPKYSKAAAAADLKTLQSYCRTRKIPFGVIFWGQDASSDQAYFNHALGWVKDVKAAIPLPGRVIFQSWVDSPGGKKTVPINLPEGDPKIFSHTRLVNAGWAALADNDAAFVSQAVPTTVKAGQQVSVTITMKNTGPLAWTGGHGYRLGAPGSTSTWGTGRVPLGPKEVVLPGAMKTFTFTAAAPGQPGSHAFQWQMVQEQVEWFGETSKLVQVTVTP